MRISFAPAAMLAAGLTLPLALPAAALPIADPTLSGAVLDTSSDVSEARIIRVYGGCGPFGHRGPYGGCRTGGQAGGYVRGRSCPAGFHIGPYGRRCWPN